MGPLNVFDVIVVLIISLEGRFVQLTIFYIEVIKLHKIELMKRKPKGQQVNCSAKRSHPLLFGCRQLFLRPRWSGRMTFTKGKKCKSLLASISKNLNRFCSL